MKDGDTIALLGDLEAAEGGFRIVRARITQGAQGFTLASSEPILVTAAPVTRARGRRSTMQLMETLPPEADAALHALVDEYRERCLWFLRRDYYPATRRGSAGARRPSSATGIARPSARRRIRQWLSPPSSATSAAS